MKFAELIKKEPNDTCIEVRFNGDNFVFTRQAAFYFKLDRIFNGCEVVSVERYPSGNMTVTLEKETNIGYDYDSMNE